MMARNRYFASVVFTFAVATVPIFAASESESFVALFNGRDLAGWVNVNCAPETWTVRDGMIVCTGIPTGVLRTKRHYENYILELDWRHMVKGGNAGLFVHSDPLQVPACLPQADDLGDGRGACLKTLRGYGEGVRVQPDVCDGTAADVEGLRLL